MMNDSNNAYTDGIQNNKESQIHRPRRRWTLKQKSKAISEHARSGLTRDQFIEERGLPKGCLYAWMKDCQKAKEKASRTPEFSPVKLIDSAPSGPKHQNYEKSIYIRVSGSLSVGVAPGFDASHLNNVLNILENRAC